MDEEKDFCYITSQRVILATGKRGQYRKLKVFGENLPHVSYHLKDPKHFTDSEIVVVGGGDSALKQQLLWQRKEILSIFVIVGRNLKKLIQRI